MPATKKASKPTRPLSCHRCAKAGRPSRDVAVESDTDYVIRDGKRRVAAFVRCSRCGHRFDSIHPDAVRLARAQKAA